jgi:hypothetical protein
MNRSDAADWSPGDDLWRELDRFLAERRADGLSPQTVRTYERSVRAFLRWLQGDFVPRGPQSKKVGSET